MVDLAIAATFVRELTEDQFAEQRGKGRRRVAEQRGNGRRRVMERGNGRRRVAEQRPHAGQRAAATRSVNGSDSLRESGRSEPARRSRTRNEATGLRRALARFAQVRG
jgi:hypothetical protein